MNTLTYGTVTGSSYGITISPTTSESKPKALFAPPSDTTGVVVPAGSS